MTDRAQTTPPGSRDPLREALVQAANDHPITADVAWEVLREWDRRGDANRELLAYRDKAQAALSEIDKKLGVLGGNLAGSVAEDERAFWQAQVEALRELTRGG